MSVVPRVVVSAPSSGHGKTAVALGLLAGYAARGLNPAGFKIGPDYVDSAYLGLASGRPARNLDPRLVGPEKIGPLFVHGAADADIAVVEGTMGLYDGLSWRTDGESTADIAGMLRAPVLLVVDVGAMGQSVAALVHGFRAYNELTWLGGVVLNRVASSRHGELLQEALGDIGVPVVGALRRGSLADVRLPPRERGVVPVVHRNLDAVSAVRRLGEVVADSVDLERVLVLARSAPRLSAEAWSARASVLGDEPTGGLQPSQPAAARPPVIAVAGGYGYVETVELLTAAGAEVVLVDPLRDDRFPQRVDGFVVGAGLPESYVEELSANERLCHAIAELGQTGRPIAAEGTGLLWLCRDFDGRPMAGVLDADALTGDMLVAGYRNAIAQTSSALLPAGTTITGHKLHRTIVSPRAGAQPAWTWPDGPPEGFVWKGVHASFLALHWAGRPEIAVRFTAAATVASQPPSAPVPPPTAPVTAVPVAAAPVTAAPAPEASSPSAEAIPHSASVILPRDDDDQPTTALAPVPPAEAS